MAVNTFGPRDLRRAARGPLSYLEAWDRVSSGLASTTFLDLLKRTAAMAEFFEATSDATAWRLERPFFAVPPGVGGRSGYERAAESFGVSIYRRIDRQTSANSLFIKLGIPGSVGSATCALWRALAELLTEDRAFRVWPFEGALRTLLMTSAATSTPASPPPPCFGVSSKARPSSSLPAVPRRQKGGCWEPAASTSTCQSRASETRHARCRPWLRSARLVASSRSRARLTAGRRAMGC